VPGPVAFADRQAGDEQADGGVDPPQAEQGAGEQPGQDGGGQVGAQQVAAGVIILATGWTRADAIASLVVVGLMLKAAWEQLAASGRILLEAAPKTMDLDDVRAHLLSTEHVRGLHDLHAWTVTSSLPALSAHIVIEDACFTDGCAPRLLDQLQACIAGHFDVEHSIFQLEAAAHADHEPGTH
jgi:cobalt-zinc-cadmium efflux system protein